MSTNYFQTNLYYIIENKIKGQTLGNYKPVSSSHNYIDGLHSLYANSIGKEDKFKSDQDIDDFVDWVAKYRNLTARYARFVKSHNIDLNDSRLAELDKSIIDSIVGRKAKIISEDASTLLRLNTKIVQKNKKTYIDNHSILIFPYNKNITKIITQNPYYSNPKLDYLMINKEGYDIYIGMYGYEDDKDKNKKIEMLDKLRHELGYGRLYIEKERDEYYSLFKAITTPRKSKVKKIVISRSHK